MLINADAWTGEVRLLPAGPWREPLRAARRANLILITRKASASREAQTLRSKLEKDLPGIPIATVHLSPGELHSTATGQTLPLQAIEGADITAVAAIAHPEAFFRQLTEIGAIVRPHSFPDHHAFTRTEANHLAEVGTRVRLRHLHSQGCRKTGPFMACRSGVIMVCFTALAGRGWQAAHRSIGRGHCSPRTLNFVITITQESWPPTFEYLHTNW